MAESILMNFITGVENGEKFSVNFEERNMRLGNKYLIKNGVYDASTPLTFSTDQSDDVEMLLRMIGILYSKYKYSTPSERSESKKRKYFKALSAEELSDEQLVCGAEREVAQARLEGFILCAILSGAFKWDENKMGKWFYQSKSDPDLVILRSWVDGIKNI